MTQHAMTRRRGPGRLKVIISAVLAAAFVTVFVGSAVGVIGGSSDVDAIPSATGGTVPGAALGDAARLRTSVQPDDGSTGATPLEETGPPVVTGVPVQAVAESRQIKRSLAWLRRGLADETTFRVGTFNVLGDSHTSPGGNRRGWASGPTRMGWAYSLIVQADLDVVGFQEFETPQYNRFNALSGEAWSSFPGPTLDRGSIRDSIAWRTDTWELVEATSVGIPYFGGQIIRRPVVKLRNLESQREVWFFNTHNPATTPRWGNNARWRAAAIGIEVKLANELGADGTPVVFTGDYNDRAEAFCPLVGGTDLEAANGGSNEEGGSCVVPPSPDVDWVFGSGMAFTGFASATQGIVGRVTDHPFVYAEAVIPEEPLGGQPPAEDAEELLNPDGTPIDTVTDGIIIGPSEDDSEDGG